MKSQHWLHCKICDGAFRPSGRIDRQCCSEACRRERDEARYVVKRVLTIAEAAYLAGLVDGEGTLSVWKERRPANITGFRYKVTFTIAQANQKFLEEIGRMGGNGSVRLCTRNRPERGHKPVYTVRFYSHQTRWLLPQLLPYLRIKRRQAELVLKFLGTTDRSRRDRLAHGERADLYDECHALNKRGL